MSEWLSPGETNQRAQYVLQDRDTKFTKKFQEILRTSDAHSVKLSDRTPILNGDAESWIGSLKRECAQHLDDLNHFIIFGNVIFITCFENMSHITIRNVRTNPWRIER